MDVMAFLAAYGPWSWIVAGLVLLGLELVVPGGFLLWLGISGILTGLITFIQPLSWAAQWAIFGGLALVSIIAWVGLSRRRKPQMSEPELNQRTARLLGQEGVLETPIESGFGRLRLGDTTWRVSGPDLPAGRKVRITGASSSVLRVEAI